MSVRPPKGSPQPVFHTVYTGVSHFEMESASVDRSRHGRERRARSWQACCNTLRGL
jgi:hypothetical protein